MNLPAASRGVSASEYKLAQSQSRSKLRGIRPKRLTNFFDLH